MGIMMRRFTVSHRYDSECDPTTWKGYNPILQRTNNPLKKAFAESRTQAALSASNKKRNAIVQKKKDEREAAEKRAADAVRQAVSILEMAMHDLNNTPGTAGQKSINQLQLHNGIVHLRQKCGVSFVETEFSHRVALDR